jgi:hypothetical protein
MSGSPQAITPRTSKKLALWAVISTRLFGPDAASKTWETDVSEIFPQKPMPLFSLSRRERAG